MNITIINPATSQVAKLQVNRSEMTDLHEYIRTNKMVAIIEPPEPSVTGLSTTSVNYIGWRSHSILMPECDARTSPSDWPITDFVIKVYSNAIDWVYGNDIVFKSNLDTSVPREQLIAEISFSEQGYLHTQHTGSGTITFGYIVQYRDDGEYVLTPINLQYTDLPSPPNTGGDLSNPFPIIVNPAASTVTDANMSLLPLAAITYDVISMELGQYGYNYFSSDILFNRQSVVNIAYFPISSKDVSLNTAQSLGGLYVAR